MVKSGKIDGDRTFALSMVKAYPDRTAIELGKIGWEEYHGGSPESCRQKIGRRLNELERTCKCGHERDAHRMDVAIRMVFPENCAECECKVFVGLIERSGTKQIGKRHATTWRAND